MLNIERTEISKALEESNYEDFIKAYRPMVNNLFREFSYSPKAVNILFGFPVEESEKIIKEIPSDMFWLISKEMDVCDKVIESKEDTFSITGAVRTYIDVKEKRIKKEYLDNKEETKKKIRNSGAARSKYENTECDYSRLYPSATCREYAMTVTCHTTRVKTYIELIDKLRAVMSMMDISLILNLPYFTISDVFKRYRPKRYPNIRKMCEVWEYDEGKYALPAEIANMIDEFEEKTFTTKTPVVKEDYRTVKQINTESEEQGEVLIDIPDVEEKVYDAEELNNDIVSSDTVETAVCENENTKVTPAPHHLILPDNYLDDDTYDILMSYFDIIGYKYMVKDDNIEKQLSVKDVMNFTMRLCKLNDEQKAKLRSVIIPIERTCGIIDGDKISELI